MSGWSSSGTGLVIGVIVACRLTPSCVPSSGGTYPPPGEKLSSSSTFHSLIDITYQESYLLQLWPT